MRTVRLTGGRFWSAVGGFFPDVCAIQECTETVDSYGEPIKSWSDVEDLEEVKCRVSPSGGTERKSPQAIWSVATHVIELCGRYAQIGPKMRAKVNDQAYDILLVQVDGFGDEDTMQGATRLVCEVVK